MNMEIGTGGRLNDTIDIDHSTLIVIYTGIWLFHRVHVAICDVKSMPCAMAVISVVKCFVTQ